MHTVDFNLFFSFMHICTNSSVWDQKTQCKNAVTKTTLIIFPVGMEEDCISVFTKNFFLMGFPVQIFLSNREFGYLGNKIWTNIQTFVRLNLTSSPSLFFCFWCLSSTQITNGEKKKGVGKKERKKEFHIPIFWPAHSLGAQVRWFKTEKKPLEFMWFWHV